MSKHTTNTTAPIFCVCGCGQELPRAKYPSRQRRYIPGHQNYRPVEPAEPKLCECGCGQTTPISKKNCPQRGYFRGQPQRFVFGHQNNVRTYPSVEERFWAKVDKHGPIHPVLGTECWLWTACVSDGWGKYGILGINGNNALAHRVSYQLHYGPIPENIFVCHKCDNPTCVRPDHLFVGTSADNSADMVRKGRKQRGEKSPQAKLKESDIIEIRRLSGEGIPQGKIAKQFGINQTQVWRIIHRKRWQHIP